LANTETTSTTTTTNNLCAPNPCLNNGTCSNLQNSYSCNCVTGFTGSICGVPGNTNI
jgi:Notch-like protein